MAYNIFKLNDPKMFQHQGAQVQQPAGYQPPVSTQPAKVVNAPGYNVAKQFLEQQSQAANAPTVQPSWGGSTTAPDGGFFDYAGRTFTTPEQEAQYKRQSRSRMGIMALGDALRHLGNIYHTTKYAPSQQFNAPVAQEYAMYKAGKAERDKDNYAISQQKLAQAKWEADQAYKAAQLGWKERDYKLKQDAAERAIDNDKWNREFKTKQFDANQEKIAADRERQAKMDEFNMDVKREQLRQGAERNAIARYNATHRSRGGSGGSRGGGNGRGTTDGYHISGRYGHLGRKKELSAREVENAYEYGLRKGWISKEDDAKVRNNGSGMTINPSDGTITYNGGKYTKREMINKMLDVSPEALDYFEDKFGMTVLDDTEGEPYFQDGWWDRAMSGMKGGVRSSIGGMSKSAAQGMITRATQQVSKTFKGDGTKKASPSSKQQVRANQQTVSNAKKATTTPNQNAQGNQKRKSKTQL